LDLENTSIWWGKKKAVITKFTTNYSKAEQFEIESSQRLSLYKQSQEQALWCSIMCAVKSNRFNDTQP
jgi:hypothetical protein